MALKARRKSIEKFPSPIYEIYNTTDPIKHLYLREGKNDQRVILLPVTGGLQVSGTAHSFSRAASTH
jgi:hypothetical protein